MILRSCSLIVTLILAINASAAEWVEVRGDAARPGRIDINSETRLADVMRAAGVNSEGYWIGAKWLQRDLIQPQRKLKAGVLFDLSLLQSKASLDGNYALANLARRLHFKIASLPVTGRRIHRLDPVSIEVTPSLNQKVHSGDIFIFPQRPASINITGAVAEDCTLRFAPMRKAEEYLKQCSVMRVADKDQLYLIQPDGVFQQLGIALWNYQSDDLPAPGSTIFVPIKSASFDSSYPALNRELAEFLATQ